MSVYLSLEQVIEINAKMTDLYDGLCGVRDHGALQAAVARPQTGYYSDAVEEAAALFESLSQNHPFLDGNKRTAIAATVVFLTCNGYRVSFDDAEAYERLMSLYSGICCYRNMAITPGRELTEPLKANILGEGIVPTKRGVLCRSGSVPNMKKW